MTTTTNLDSPQRKTTGILVWLTLAASAVHFTDNALRLDLYPGPPWLTQHMVQAAWLALPVLAWLAWRNGTRPALIVYGLLGFAGFAHYWAAPQSPHGAMPLRCAITIWGEAIASAILIAYVLLALKGNLPPKGSKPARP